MAASRSRLSKSLATVLALSAAGGLCWASAQAAAGFIEKRSREDVQLAMNASGKDWVQVTTDGLQVRLSGTAPTEVDRFRAMTAAATVVDSSRVVDDMTVASSEALAPPAFKVELLRNDEGISIIGLVPTATDRGALVRLLRSETAAPQITDLLETSDHEVPDNWDAAMLFGLRAAQMTPRAKISIEPGTVSISAITDSRDEKGRLETALTRAVPDGVTLNTDISAPRPVISPFTLRFLIDEEGARFDACAADTEEGRTRIIDAAVAAGVQGIPGCTLGLGAPSPSWSEGAAAAIEAVAELGAGSVTLSDADIALIAPPTVEQAAFDTAVGKLEQALPDVFSLQTELQRPEAETDQGPIEFTATLAENQNLTMRGRITDARMREAVDSIATSRFAEVQASLRTDETVPQGWTVRVIGALEALDALHAGSVNVTPELIEMSGTSGDPEAAEIVAGQLSQRLGPGANYELSIRYDRQLDPALNLPDGPECVRQLNIIMSETEIGFEPSKSAIAGDPDPTLQRLAAVMSDCRDYQVEAGGHTDSQGSTGFNADLSRGRAQAIVTAMREAGIDVSNMTSRGYGESQPIATNETEEGREENRRIEFRLMSERPVRGEPLPPPITIQGTTQEIAATTPETLQASIASLPDAADMIGPPFITYTATVIRELLLPTDMIDPEEDEQMQGPMLPSAHVGPVAPAVLGASEEFQPLDLREENITLPVQTPGADTPRPSPRPENEGTDDAQSATE